MGIVADYVPYATMELKDGTGFLLNSRTRIKGNISQEAVVEIEAIMLGDGTLLATEIEAREPPEDDDGESTGHSLSGGDDDDDDEDKSGSSDGEDDEDKSGSSD